jgi:hypothetical protein
MRPSTSNNDLQFSSNPHDWLYSQACGAPVNPFDSVYGDYYIIDKNKKKKKHNRIVRFVKKILHH